MTPEAAMYRRVVLGRREFYFQKGHYDQWKRRNEVRTVVFGSRRIDTMPRQTPLPMWLYEAGWR